MGGCGRPVSSFVTSRPRCTGTVTPSQALPWIQQRQQLSAQCLRPRFLEGPRPIPPHPSCRFSSRSAWGGREPGMAPCSFPREEPTPVGADTTRCPRRPMSYLCRGRCACKPERSAAAATLRKGHPCPPIPRPRSGDTAGNGQSSCQPGGVPEGCALWPCQSDTLDSVPSLKAEMLACTSWLRAAYTPVLHQGWGSWYLLSTQAGLSHLPDFLSPALSSLTRWAGSGYSHRTSEKHPLCFLLETHQLF